MIEIETRLRPLRPCRAWKKVMNKGAAVRKMKAGGMEEW